MHKMATRSKNLPLLTAFVGSNTWGSLFGGHHLVVKFRTRFLTYLFLKDSLIFVCKEEQSVFDRNGHTCFSFFTDHIFRGFVSPSSVF